MELSKNSNNISLHSLTSNKEKRKDSVPFRIEFIKTLLEGKRLQPMVNFDSTDTENFVSVNKYNSFDGSGDSKSNDTRYVLNKKLLNFNKIINQIGGNLIYIKSGTTGHTFKGILPIENGEKISYAVKVVAYPRRREQYGEMNALQRPENAELVMIKLLSYFVVKKQTPHIVLPIGTFNTSIKPFVDLIKTNIVEENNKKYKEFVERYDKGQYHRHVSILISEWANKGDLLDFIKTNYKQFKLKHWKVIFFQLLSVLAVIHKKFPSFRHNDLKANNILVHKISPRKVLFSYVINGKKYYTPNIGYHIKIWDFDFACIPGIVDNAKVSAKWTDEINVSPEQNRYYDMHYFFNTLIKKGFFPEFMSNQTPIEAREFVNRIVPPKYQYGECVHERGRILVKSEYLTPDEVLKKDPFFEEFRSKKINKKIYTNHKKEFDKLIEKDFKYISAEPKRTKTSRRYKLSES